jgi:hypothetical protein
MERKCSQRPRILGLAGLQRFGMSLLDVDTTMAGLIKLTNQKPILDQVDSDFICILLIA